MQAAVAAGAPPRRAPLLEHEASCVAPYEPPMSELGEQRENRRRVNLTKPTRVLTPTRTSASRRISSVTRLLRAERELLLCPEGYAAAGPASSDHAARALALATHSTAVAIGAKGRTAFVRPIRRAEMPTDQAVTASICATPRRALTAGSHRESPTGAPHP
jgi:hypothetical protein